jgi:hypothetical protein
MRKVRPKAEPWMFLTGAGLCVMLTILLSIVGSPFAARTGEGVVQATDARAEDSGPADAQPVAMPEPIERPQAADGKPNVRAERQIRLKTLPAEELAALNAETLAGQRDRPAAHGIGTNDGSLQRNPFAADEARIAQGNRGGAQFALDPRNPVGGVPNQGVDNEEFTQDPITGAWFTKSNIWHVRDKYCLPLDGVEIQHARFCVSAIGVNPLIEMQWWFPRSVDVPEKHFRGKLAKLRFLAVLAPSQIQRAADHVRIIQTRGCTSDGSALVDAEAIFFSPSWNLAATEVKEQPDWFPDHAASIGKGGTERLSLTGREIELVRRALHAEEAGSRIREVRWWPPRVNRADRHRLSKLRYEIGRNGVVRIDEIVFDHTDQKVRDRSLPDGYFPELDRHSVGLEQAHW